MDELQALERWGELYTVSIYVHRGTWRCTIMEPSRGTADVRRWEDCQVVGTADHDPILAMQSALIQARAKWPKVIV